MEVLKLWRWFGLPGVPQGIWGRTGQAAWRPGSQGPGALFCYSSIFLMVRGQAQSSTPRENPRPKHRIISFQGDKSRETEPWTALTYNHGRQRPHLRRCRFPLPWSASWPLSSKPTISDFDCNPSDRGSAYSFSRELAFHSCPQPHGPWNKHADPIPDAFASCAFSLRSLTHLCPWHPGVEKISLEGGSPSGPAVPTCHPLLWSAHHTPMEASPTEWSLLFGISEIQ